MSRAQSVTIIVCSTLWYGASVMPMHSMARRAAVSIASASGASDFPMIRLKSSAKNGPSASAANSETVTILRFLHQSGNDIVQCAVECTSDRPSLSSAPTVQIILKITEHDLACDLHETVGVLDIGSWRPTDEYLLRTKASLIVMTPASSEQDGGV